MERMRKAWNPLIVVPILGVLSAYFFGITSKQWAVTGEFTRWGGHLMNFVGIDTSKFTYFKMIKFQGTPLDRVDGVMIIGMFIGAFVAALISNNVKFRLPTSKTRVFQALGGGIMAGFGARLAMGCNLAAFFTGIPQFSLHAWFFTIFTIIGTYVGTRIIKEPVFQSKIKLKKVHKNTLYNIHEKDNSTRNNWLLIISTLLILFLFVVEYNKQSLFPLVLVFGLAFGFLLEKGQVCFTSAFRDLWTAGRSNMTVAIILGMIISTIGTFAFIQNGTPAVIHWAGWNTVIGGFIFGVGIVIAGGCETGWMYRAVEGQVHYMLVGVGNILGSILLVLVWDKVAPVLAYNGPEVNLLKTFGPYGGLIITYVGLLVMLGLVYVYVKWYFRKVNKKQSVKQGNLSNEQPAQQV